MGLPTSSHLRLQVRDHLTEHRVAGQSCELVERPVESQSGSQQRDEFEGEVADIRPSNTAAPSAQPNTLGRAGLNFFSQDRHMTLCLQALYHLLLTRGIDLPLQHLAMLRGRLVSISRHGVL